MNRITLLTLVMILSLAQLAAAQEEAVKLDEVVITATRYIEEVSSIPANVTIVTEKDIENSTAQSIPDVLRTEMGILVNDVGGNRRNITVDIRGFGETAQSNTLVLVDGRRVNQADLSGTDWTQISLDRVKRIEVVRGGQGSVLYGDNAAGGVINIITKEGDARKAGAGAAAGSYDTYKGNVFFSNRTDRLSYSLTGSYLSSDGYRDNSDTEAKDAGINISYYAGERVNLNLSAGYHKDNTGLPGAIKDSQFSAGRSRTESVNPRDFAEVEDYYFKGGPEIYFGDENFIKLDASYRKRSFLSFASFFGGSFLGDTEIKTWAFSPQLVLRQETGTVKNSMNAGVDYENAEEEIINDSSFSGKDDFELEKKNYGYYLHDELALGDRLSLSGGYRYDRAQFIFNSDVLDGEETTMDEDLYTAGITYRFYKNSHAYFSYSRSFRYPLLDESFSFFENTVNADLLPQKSDNFEIGLRHYITDDISASVNLFRIDTNDEIFYNPSGGAFGFGANENLDGKSRRDGVEAAFNAIITRWLSLSGSYSYIDSTIRDGQYEESDIPNVPNHKATLEAIVSPVKGLTIALNGIYIGERSFIGDFANQFDDQESYIVINSKVKYQWKNLSAFLDLNNLTDKEYSEYGVIGGFPAEKAFYPSPEFNVLFGVSVEL